MEELWMRFWGNLVDRVSGPMHFRLLLQPAVATIFAIRGGLKDAREGKSAYFWTILADRAHRRDLLREGWKAVTKVFFMAVIIDAVYQVIALRWFYPGEALLVACVLALLPYLLIRGPANRLARLFLRRPNPGPASKK